MIDQRAAQFPIKTQEKIKKKLPITSFTINERQK